ncbi:MAG: DUF58 domain-containing protein [Pirellulales bacterium]|nr:DUF58 domain-containing protein [Pirellulales bacterium]
MLSPRRTVICREGWYYLVVLALVLGGAMFREVNLLLLLAGIMAGPLWFSWQAVRRTLVGLQVERKVPHGVCAGDLLVTSLTLTNTRRRIGSWGVVVEDEIGRAAGDVGGKSRGQPPIRAEVLFPYIAAGRPQTGVYRGRLPQRGRYRLGPLRLSTRFPFGLFRRTISVGQRETLTVFPRLGRLTRSWLRRHRESLAGTQRRERRAGLDGDVYGVRPWRSGDSRRWIHWRTSARAGELVVRQFEQPRNRDLAVLLDLWQPERPTPEHLENVELAVSFAATVVSDLCRRGNADMLLGIGGPQPQCIRGPASVALLQDLMQRLAVAEAHGEDTLPELLTRAAGQIDPGTEVIVIGTRPSACGDASRREAARQRLARRAGHREIRYLDAASDELARYYQPE